MRRFRRWSLRAKIAGITVSAIILFVITAAIAGIIGNRADALFILLLGLVTSSVSANSLPWIIIILILLIGLFTVVGFWGNTKSNLKITNQIVDLDDRLLRLVPNLVSAGNLEEEMHRLIYKLLERATVVFDGEVNRASLFLPDPDRKQLRIWHGYQMPPESIRRTVFNIEVGGSGIMRGIAGETFLDGQPHVVHLRRENDQWRADRESSYIFFDQDRRSLPSLPYQSCVCVPISVGTDLADRLGVVCFDSHNPIVFDSAETEDSELQKRLIVLGGRFASTLLIYEELKRSLQSRQQAAQTPP